MLAAVININGHFITSGPSLLMLPSRIPSSSLTSCRDSPGLVCLSPVGNVSSMGPQCSLLKTNLDILLPGFRFLNRSQLPLGTSTDSFGISRPSVSASCYPLPSLSDIVF